MGKKHFCMKVASEAGARFTKFFGASCLSWL
jgi:hypothetical protein